ncbi:M23 family metallopeptidase [Cohnella zeiphila]|nr:M23 family metallopeptidase [Cohnella zeiphila]
MDANRLIKKRAIWWVVGSVSVTGIAIVLLGFMLAFAVLGALIGASDTSGMEGIPVPDEETFDVPAPLLPIYIRAENEKASWARLAAIHKVTNDFGADQPKRFDTIGPLGFPRPLWEAYRIDGDGDGKIDPDNPYDAIFSLAHYLQVSSLDADETLRAWFLNEEDVEVVHRQESAYTSMLHVHASGEWLWPLIGYTNISSPFGNRVDPVTGAPIEFHAGVDIPAPLGTPVLATQNGTVVQTIRGNMGYGNHILLQHAGGFISLYGHLSDIGVKTGQQVQRGEVIGWTGSTGKSTGPHLHFEIRLNGQAVNPMDYFKEGAG